MNSAVFLLDPDNSRQAKPFTAGSRPAQVLKTQAEVTTAVSRRAVSIFVAVHANPLLRWLARSTLGQTRHRLLVLDRLAASRSAVLRGLFASVVVPDGVWQLLPNSELAEAVAAANAADLIIGGVVNEEAGVIRFVKGDLESLVVPVSAFKHVRGGPRPVLDKMEFTDYGQTIKLGEYEVATDAVLYEFDPGFRRRARVRLRAEDKTFGGGLRRLRLQRGLGREDFTGISAKEIARIERGETKKPHDATLKAIAETLSVRLADIGDY